MEIKFDDNMVEQNFNFQGVKVKVRKNDEDEYQIWIEDDKNRFIQSKLPGAYEYIRAKDNNITFDDVCEKWWSSLLCNISLHGYFNNGDVMDLEQINACVNAVFNGVNTLEKITLPEVIKIGNVEITKKKLDENNVSLIIKGLLQPLDYPNDIYCDSYLAWSPDNEVFDLWDKNHKVVWINNKQWFPLKDFICSNSDMEKIIEIITGSEEKLVQYRLEQEEIKVGDYVKPKYYDSDYKYKIIGIYNDEILAQSIGRRSITGIYKKSSFVKDNTKL